MPRLKIANILLLNVLVIASLCPGANAAEPYEINAILPLTGAAAFIGSAEAKSLGVIEELTNRLGGIEGRSIKFVIQDDQSTPQVAVQLMSGLVNKKVQVVLGSTLVAVCNAMSALIKDGPVQWCFSSAFRPPAGSYAFSTGVSSALLSDFVVRYTRQRGWSKTALLTSTDATGQDGDRTFDTTLALPENLRVVMVAHEHFNIGDLSVAAQIARIKTSGAQVLFAWTTGTQLATILHAASDAGLAIPIVTTSGNSTYPQMKAYASFLPKEFYFTGVLSLAPNELPNSPVKSTILSYLSAFRSTGIRPDIGSNQAWDGAQILIEALKKLGLNATPSQIRDYVVNLRGWSGINGQYDFQRYPQRGVGLEWLTMQRWDTAKDSWVGVSKLGGAPF